MQKNKAQNNQELDQGLTANKWQHQDLNLGLSEAIPYTISHYTLNNLPLPLEDYGEIFLKGMFTE